MVKKREQSIGYVFVFYDAGENRVHKLFKVCKKYLEHHQNSVFRGVITPSNLMKMEKELKTVMDIDYDRVTILKMRDGHVFTEVELGVPNKKSNQMFM